MSSESSLPSFPIVARASTTVRNKNAIMVLLCAVFLGLFAYDGVVGYPKKNDQLVQTWREKLEKENKLIDPEHLVILNGWEGWNNSTDDERDQMYNLLLNVYKEASFKSRLDIYTQIGITAGLVVATFAAIWWFIHCQKRRVIADETKVSPAPGVEIPWEWISKVDNTKWKRSGIVTITYRAAGGEEQTAKFDDYIVERKPLIEVLKLMETKATKAEFFPKETAPEGA